MMITDDFTIELLIKLSLIIQSNKPHLYLRDENYIKMFCAYLEIKEIEYVLIEHPGEALEITIANKENLP